MKNSENITLQSMKLKKIKIISNKNEMIYAINT